ncbi:MAG: hypothetical protein OEY36_08770 [Gammaproteobacteria bacterium]|nr:hypothetical protein [Gammaproteobacteria bacterium]
MPELKTSNECIEFICAQGCTAVRKVIVQLENKQTISELVYLQEEQKQFVLTELKAIMSVYDKQDES